MQRRVYIGVRQYQILVILYTIGTTVLITPSGLADEIKQDAWMAPIFAIGPGLLLVLLYNGISRVFPGMTIAELCESLLGVWFGKAVTLLFVVFSFLASAMVLFDVGRFITTIIMPETPDLVINILFVILLVYAIGSGLDVLARMVELLFPAFVLFFLLVVVFVSPQIDLQNTQPLFESSTNSLLSATISVLSIGFMPLVAFLMVQPIGLKHPKSERKAFVIAVLIGSIMSVIIVALTILVLGSNVTSMQEYPVYYLAQKINIGNTFERIESTVAVMWLIAIFAKMSIYFYAAVSGLVHIAKLKNQRSVLLPMAFLLVVVSVDIFPSSTFENKFNSSDWVALVFIIGVVIPLILLILGLLKQRSKKRTENEKK